MSDIATVSWLELLVKLLVFTVVSIIFAYLSRASLRKPRSHGFYRFFAWESILGLFLLNVDGWFDDPLSWHQLISWPLLVISVFLIAQAVVLLHRMGKPDDLRSDVPLYGLEKTTALVESGVYRYIRHPMYSSLLCLAWGIFFKDPSWLGGLLVVTATIFLVLTAIAEENENIRYFGPVYQQYMQRTKRFIPIVF